jgi:hypothetical protein
VLGLAGFRSFATDENQDDRFTGPVEPWAGRILDQFPGCRYAAEIDSVRGEAVVVARDARRWSLSWADRDAEEPSSRRMPTIEGVW